MKVIRGYLQSDFIFFIRLYFNGRKTKKQANFQVFNYWSRTTKQKTILQKSVTEKLKSWLTIPKNTQNMQERSKCVHLEKLIRGLWNINKPLSGLLVLFWRTMPSVERLNPTVHFLDNLSPLGIILLHTSCRSCHFTICIYIYIYIVKSN